MLYESTVHIHSVMVQLGYGVPSVARMLSYRRFLVQYFCSACNSIAAVFLDSPMPRFGSNPQPRLQLNRTPSGSRLVLPLRKDPLC